jgi:hypothetical protein
MARSINDLYNLGLYIVRKERGVFLTTTKFSANLDAGQYDAFEEYFKLYGIDQTVHDALRPFRTYVGFLSGVDGTVGYQTNYLHLLGAPFTIIGSTINQIKFVNEDELPFALTSQLRAVTTSYPIAVETSSGFKIYPEQAQYGAYWYLRKPATPVWGGTQVGRDVTYNSLTSTQLEWTESYWNNILAKTLRYSGVNMNEQGVYEYASQYNMETKAQ